MKRIFLFIVILVAPTIFFQYLKFCQNTKKSNIQSSKFDAVNVLIGDLSFVEKYGTFPDHGVNENLRISTHLEYVENQLRQKGVKRLSSTQRKARLRNIELLQEYRLNGIFPKNYDYPNQRKPCFIDKYERICAIGYLIEKTAGRKVAEAVNAKFQYRTIFEMKSADLETWIYQSGISKNELAMIQPVYEFREEDGKNSISKELEVLGIGLAGSSAVLNGIYVSKKKRHFLAGILGVLLGATSLFTGFSDKANYSFPDKLLGVSSVVSGILNLSLGNEKDKNLKHQTSMFQKPEVAFGIIALEKRFGLGLRMNWTF